MNKIYGTLLYVCVNRPVKAYVEAGQPSRPDEWKAQVVVTDEDVVDAYEEFATNLNAKTSVKKVRTDKFEEEYGIEPPEDAGKNVWIITVRKSTELGKTGKPVPDEFKPRVFEKVVHKGKSILKDITATKLVGNGSKGAVSLEVFQRNNGTASIYLKNVLVTDLIEYIPEEREYVPAGGEFEDEGEVVKDDVVTEDTKQESKKEDTETKSTKSTKTTKSAKLPVQQPDDDDPF